MSLLLNATRALCKAKTRMLRPRGSALFSSTMVADKRVAILGGAGQLGRAVVDEFKKSGWDTVSIDVHPNKNATETIQSAAFTVEESIESTSKKTLDLIKTTRSGAAFDTIICVAGGWQGDGDGGPQSDTFLSSVDAMLSVNLKSAVTAAYLAATCLKPNGMLTLTGAVGALRPSPGMLGYGMAKAATHHLVRSLAFDNGMVAGFSGVAFPCHINAILPGVLDTPPNRDGMPDADTSSWTPLPHVSSQLVAWAEHAEERPPNGSLVEIVTKSAVTQFRVLQ